jgi:biopolymer transport protein TolQ
MNIKSYTKILAILGISMGFTAQAAGPAKVAIKTGVLDAVLGAGPFVLGLLLLMAILSVISWTIIFVKWTQLHGLRAKNASFSDRFWQAPSLESINEKIGDYAGIPVARVFKAAFTELQRIADSGLADRAGAPAQHRLRGLDNIERTLRKAIDTEIAACETQLGFLATTGSTAPFVGLLGTVVGIMTSFAQISASGSASLAVVAPGISEALFSTAVGLFAALPAVAGYNYFIGEVRRIEMDMSNFASDFLNVAKRNFFREG